MTIIRTDLGETRERAREIRFEPTAPITATNVQKAIEQAAAQAQGVNVPTSISFANSPYTVLATDTLLYVDTAGGSVVINLQPQAARLGIDLGIKDVTGHAAANPMSLVPNGAETVDLLAPYPVTGDFAGVRLNPKTGGYAVIP